MAITNSSLYSGSFDEIKNFINTNITDPKRRYKKDWIHPSLPNITSQKFDGYPFIVMTVDVSETNKAFDRSTSNKQFVVRLAIYSDQSLEVDTISDEIISKFKDETLTNSLSSFKSIELSGSPFSFEIIEGRKIHVREVGIRGIIRL